MRFAPTLRPAAVTFSVVAALLAPTTPAHAAPAAPGDTVTLPVREAPQALEVQEESRAGYTRDKFKHWNAGQFTDGCNARAEVLKSEAVTAPAQEANCVLTGGRWYSAYDDAYLDSAASWTSTTSCRSPKRGTAGPPAGARRSARHTPTTRTPRAP